jgi:hypothetical protein
MRRMMRELQQQTVQILSETIDAASTTAAADSITPPASAAGRGQEQPQHDERPHRSDPPQTDEELSNAAEDALKLDDEAEGMEDEPMVASEEEGDVQLMADDEEMLGFDDD